LTKVIQRDKLLEKTIIISKSQNSSNRENLRKRKKIVYIKQFSSLFTAGNTLYILILLRFIDCSEIIFKNIFDIFRDISWTKSETNSWVTIVGKINSTKIHFSNS